MNPTLAELKRRRDSLRPHLWLGPFEQVSPGLWVNQRRLVGPVKKTITLDALKKRRDKSRLRHRAKYDLRSAMDYHLALCPLFHFCTPFLDLFGNLRQAWPREEFFVRFRRGMAPDGKVGSCAN